MVGFYASPMQDRAPTSSLATCWEASTTDELELLLILLGIAREAIMAWREKLREEL